MKLRIFKTVTLLTSVVIISNSCVGSFSLSDKLFSWNKNVTQNKYANSALFFVMGFVLPIYGGSLLLDAVVFNTIEFWTGSNPLAFSSEETFEKVITEDGKVSKLTMGNNVLKIEQSEDGTILKLVSLRYEPKTGDFLLEGLGMDAPMKVGSLNGSVVSIRLPDGKTITHSLEGATATTAMR